LTKEHNATVLHSWAAHWQFTHVPVEPHRPSAIVEVLHTALRGCKAHVQVLAEEHVVEGMRHTGVATGTIGTTGTTGGTTGTTGGTTTGTQITAALHVPATLLTPTHTAPTAFALVYEQTPLTQAPLL